MSHLMQVSLSDDAYEAVVSLATPRDETPEALIQAWVEEKRREEEEYRRYDEAFANDPEWLAGLELALEQVDAGRVITAHSTEELFAIIDAAPYAGNTEDANV